MDINGNRYTHTHQIYIYIYMCVCVGGIHVGVMAFVWDFNVNHSATTKNAEFTHKWMALRTLSL